ITDAGEFKNLDDMGIASIALTSDGKFQIINGQTVHGVGKITKKDGSTLNMADVTFEYSNVIQVPHADGTTSLAVKPAFTGGDQDIQGTTGNDVLLGTD